LGYNQLRELNGNWFKFKSLVELNLECNQIISIPNEVCEMKTLKSLILTNNQIKEMPENLVNLELLVLSGNSLESLPESITRLKQLKTLILTDNLFSFQEKVKIKKSLSACDIVF